MRDLMVVGSGNEMPLRRWTAHDASIHPAIGVVDQRIQEPVGLTVA